MPEPKTVDRASIDLLLMDYRLILQEEMERQELQIRVNEECKEGNRMIDFASKVYRKAISNAWQQP